MAKELRPLDRRAQELLSAAATASGKPHHEIGALVGLSQNRVSKILRGDTPPATVGEFFAIASAVGASGPELLLAAENDLLREEGKAARPTTLASVSPLPGYSTDDTIMPSAAYAADWQEVDSDVEAECQAQEP